ncbi:MULTISPECIES: ureidoglycolate lyase [Acinetobacter]|mgnify:FL=1|nr:MULTISPECIES: ureidoglycolate lyase [Acinetobacter]
MSMPFDLQTIHIEPLTKANFAAFGEVIQCAEQDFFHINNAHTERYHAIAVTQTDQAQSGISIFRNIKSTVLPCTICMLERHPLGSQAFIPMHGQIFLIVVAPALDANQPDLSQLRAFISNGEQGVNYHAGTWHHPLLTLEAPSQFVVIDRIGTGQNCDVIQFATPIQLCTT